ncbi:CNNM domain-containing protein, partial [Enterococcus faecium]|uniref:CNNM domain-containing protein n=3 Tax=Enterococcus faecium TaxID=1352 RepID=UPI003F42A34A
MVINFIILFLMIAITSFFVASEFALVKIRRSRLEQLEKENVKNAKLALHVTHHLDNIICQIKRDKTFHLRNSKKLLMVFGNLVI